jgi:hypothetical protein
MNRIFFQRASSGFRTVRGEIIRKIQQGLQQEGFYRDTIDNVFGDKTEQALVAFQQQKGLPTTGKVDAVTWQQITSTNIPDIKQRALQITADFEGTGFTKAVGNFDGAGLTWGIIGFTLSNGELQKVIKEIREIAPEVFKTAFGSLANDLVDIFNSNISDQMHFANSISIGSNKMKILPQWAEAFERLGLHPVVQDVQIKHTRFGVENELGLALCFDIAVQNGGIDSNEGERIKKKIQQSHPTTPQELRIIIANVVAENSRPRFVEDVRKRKMTFAVGLGNVHQANYEVKGWGLDEIS